MKAYRSLVCWRCGRSSIPNQDIDDLSQDVFAAVAKALACFEHKTFRGFLWTVTRNKIQNYWRRQSKHPMAQGGSSIQQILANVEAESSRKLGSVDQTTKIVFDGVVQIVRGQFTEQDWQAFSHFAVEGRTAADVAETLEISRNQVYLSKSRILRRIRQEFGGGTVNQQI